MKSPLCQRASAIASSLLLVSLLVPGAVAADAGPVSGTIQVLQSMGNRSTHEQQWAAARWIAARFAESGLDVEILEYEHEGKTWPNVSGTLPGSERPEEVVLAIAHLDSISWERPGEAPGADDNGSGIAVLIEAARGLQSQRRARTIQFAVFSNEERSRIGSKDFARKARSSGRNLVAVVNVDTVGFSSPPSIFDWDGLLGIGSAWRAAGAVKTMIANYVRSFTGPAAGIRVVGRPANESLVRAVGTSMRQHAHVEEVVREDCG